MRNKMIFGLLLGLLSGPVMADQVCKIDIDKVGNDSAMDAISTPKVADSTCHIAYCKRGLSDRLPKDDWVSGASNSVTACRRTGPIKVWHISQ